MADFLDKSYNDTYHKLVELYSNNTIDFFYSYDPEPFYNKFDFSSCVCLRDLCSLKLIKLSTPIVKSGLWTDKEVSKLLQLHSIGHTTLYIAHNLNRTVNSVINKIQKETHQIKGA